MAGGAASPDPICVTATTTIATICLQLHHEMQLAIDEGDFKWAGLVREAKAVLERGEEGHRGDLAVRRARLQRLLHAKVGVVRSVLCSQVVAAVDHRSRGCGVRQDRDARCRTSMISHHLDTGH